MKPQSLSAVSTASKTTQVSNTKAEEAPLVSLTPVTANTFLSEKKTLTIDELTAKAEKLSLLRNKYEEVKRKHKQLECFSLKHDEENAQLTIADSNGEEIQTSNPKSIRQVISIWSDDLITYLDKVEKEMRSILEA